MKNIVKTLLILLIFYSTAFSGVDTQRIIIKYNNILKKGNQVIVKNRRSNGTFEKYVFNKKEFIKKIDWPGKIMAYGFTYQVIVKINKFVRKQGKIFYYCSIVRRIGPRKQARGGM